jgi:hypothetical protein
MKKVIVTTTINSVTKAIEKFQQKTDWELVVIGDLKTPSNYRLERGIYVTPEEQEKYDHKLSDAIGWNCIQRRNFGLLWALDMEADIVALVDDDNIPLDGWGEDLLIGREVKVNFFETDLPSFDPICASGYTDLWHRGYPLQLLAQRNYSKKTEQLIIADVQADFWNGDPDIDAICRMEHAPECSFSPGNFPLAGNKIAPFNSQNTFLRGSLLNDYFLFPHIGRMDDIWASFYVQSKGARVVYGCASVYQERNPHDLVRDMRQEYLGYENNLQLISDIAKDSESITKYLPGRSLWAFNLYRRHFKNV